MSSVYSVTYVPGSYLTGPTAELWGTKWTYPSTKNGGFEADPPYRTARV